MQLFFSKIKSNKISFSLEENKHLTKVLRKKINEKINVTLVHGEKDKSVPKHYSKKILKMFKKAKKRLVIVKNGDHSLSSNKWLKILIKELSLMI